jgi:hypothetical protein
VTRDRSYIKKLKEFTRGDLSFADLPLLEQEMYFSSDRGCVLMLGSVVETALTELLKKRTEKPLDSDDRRRLFDYEGPLGTFASKILLARAMGFIDVVAYRDLDLIRQLRNEFAHSRRHFGFETPEVVAVCANLQTPDLPGTFIPFGYLSKVPDKDLKNARDKKHPKTRYLCACHSLAEKILYSAREFTAAVDLSAGVL